MTSSHGRSADSIRELAARANVPVQLAEDLAQRGVITDDDERAAGRLRLLHAWVQAGLSLEDVLDLVDRQQLSLAFLDTPAMATAERLDRTFEELSRARDLSLAEIADLYAALGLEPPRSSDRVGEDDELLIDLLAAFQSVGAPQEAILRLYAVYADSLRRLAKAEAEFYEANIEGKLRSSGLSEEQLMRFGSEFGARVNDLREQAISMIYRRHREHVWFEHAIGHVESALDQSDVGARIPKPPSICFVDLTGYTRLTEERGDAFAAEVAGQLASLVKDISRRRGGRPIRWLGDGGMYYFRDPSDAVVAGLDMVEASPAVGLPPAHIGIHTGAVISQDGDVYGRTVNIASRIASVAEGGQVLVSAETVEAASASDRADATRFEPLGSFPLKGLADDVTLWRAFRGTAT